MRKTCPCNVIIRHCYKSTEAEMSRLRSRTTDPKYLKVGMMSVSDTRMRNNSTDSFLRIVHRRSHLPRTVAYSLLQSREHLGELDASRSWVCCQWPAGLVRTSRGKNMARIGGLDLTQRTSCVCVVVLRGGRVVKNWPIYMLQCFPDSTRISWVGGLECGHPLLYRLHLHRRWIQRGIPPNRERTHPRMGQIFCGASFRGWTRGRTRSAVTPVRWHGQPAVEMRLAVA
jgi:hypothetical protein